MSVSRIITEADERLDNVHPGHILREDFLIGSEIPLEEVASSTGVDASVLETLLHAGASVDAELDLRLGRYFGTSEGFFLRLQNGYDLEEVRRRNGDELDRIIRRAA